MSCSRAGPSFLASLAFVLLTTPSTARYPAKGQAHFRWLEEKTDERLWAKIHGAFGDELTPDDPLVVGLQVAMGHKAIYRVGLYESSALIVIALERDATMKTPARFRSYTYDTESQQKEVIEDHTAGGIWQLRVVQLAHFEPTPVPDVVFQYRDCVACEAQTLLASYRFDMTEKKWKRRNWEMGTSPHRGWTIPVGSNAEEGFDPEDPSHAAYLYQTTCALRIADLNGDGLDDVATWCHEKVIAVEPPKAVHAVSDKTLLFTVKDGVTKLLEIQGTGPASALNRQICNLQPSIPPCTLLPGSR
jgi:hypothetical protein